MKKAKVTLSIDEETWKEFRIYCIKNNSNASEILNDLMASILGLSPRSTKYDVRARKK